MSRRYLGLDFETFSDVDIQKCGSFKYMDSPVFEPLLLSYAFDDEPVVCLDLTEVGTNIPTDLLHGLFDPSVIKCAYNAQFERYAIQKWLGRYTPPEEWLDTMPLAAACGLPLGLAAVGNAMRLEEENAKMREGKDLIRYFCIPCRPTKANGFRTRNLPQHAPEKWERFKSYNIRDVEVERTIRKEVMSLKDIDETEFKFWCLDARINERGVRFDRDMAEHAVEFAERHETELLDEAVKLTGLENPKSVAQIKTWLKEQEGVDVPSLNKQVVADVVKGFETDEAKRFMELRSEFSKTSVSKYKAMLACGSDSDHVRGCFQFNGGHTGRFAGRLLQLQNLPHDKMADEAGARDLLKDGDFDTFECLYGDIFTSLSRLIRPTLIPEDGCRFIVADFSAIEARVIAWLAGEQWVLDAFNRGEDIYCATASSMFHVPVVKHGENGHLRAKGKLTVLGCGYGGGVNALKNFGADKMGLSDEEILDMVDRWRTENPRICAFWRALEQAAIKAVTRKSSAISEVGNIRFDYENGILWMSLPSGRRMAYWHPRYEESQIPGKHGKVLSYEYMLQGKRLWTRIETWGGKIAENCIARDTPVLTRRGWVPIQEVTRDDLVWDGVGYVKSLGAKSKGTQRCIEADGIWMTPDHLILTKEGWKSGRTVSRSRLHGATVRLPDSSTKGVETEAREVDVDSPVRLWPHTRRHYSRPEKGNKVLRLHDEDPNWESQFDTRDVTASGLRGMALHETTVYRTDAKGLGQLRWARDTGVRPLVEQLREFLGRHGGDLRTRFDHRPCRRQRGLRAKQLSMDELGNANEQQARERSHRDPRRNHDRSTGIKRVWPWRNDNPVPTRPRMAGRTTPSPCGCTESEVFDIINCGPRHRFTVRSADGRPVVVHNCVQATARDCLRETMLNLAERGYDIRMHVHDEVICNAPYDSDQSLKEVLEIMSAPIPWAPGLPLVGDGFESPYYTKD